MFLLTFRHALRSQEARSLRLDDIDLSAETITIRRVKGSKSSVQNLDRHKGEPLLDEVVACRPWQKGPVEEVPQTLFPSPKAGRLTRMHFYGCSKPMKLHPGQHAAF